MKQSPHKYLVSMQLLYTMKNLVDKYSGTPVFAHMSFKEDVRIAVCTNGKSVFH